MDPKDAPTYLKAAAEIMGATDVRMEKDCVTMTLPVSKFGRRTAFHKCAMIAHENWSRRVSRTAWQPQPGELVINQLCSHPPEQNTSGLVVVKSVKGEIAKILKPGETGRGTSMGVHWLRQATLKRVEYEVVAMLSSYDAIVSGACLFQPTKQWYDDYNARELPRIKHNLRELFALRRKLKRGA